MAANKIKGLTVEIGGDTTKLGKALESVNKKSRDLSSELGEINKMLKFDPGNADLLAQKQKVLAEAVENTSEKLKTLKAAEEQVQKQFERGEVSEAQYRALQREIMDTERKLGSYEKAVKETAEAMNELSADASDTTKDTKKLRKGSDDAGDSLDDLADSADKAGTAGEGMGTKFANAAKTGLKAVAGLATAAVGAMVGAAEATREYRTEMGKLEAAYTASGHESEAATAAYKTLQGVIGETDQSVEAAQQIALLAESEEDVAKWADLAAGVVGTFGDALQPETFYEAANETLKLGEATGAYTQMLEGTGLSVEEFNAGLAACNTEAEKQAYMLAVTESALGAAGEAYKKNNEEVIRANEANEAWMASMAEVGGAVEPILTDIKMMGASLLSEFVPGVQAAADALRGVINGEAGATEALGSALSGMVTQLLNKVVELAPTLVQVAMSLITTLVTTIITMLPQIIQTGIEIIMAILNGVTSAIPQIVQAIVQMVPQLVQALVTGIPMLIQGAVQFLLAILQAIPQIIPPLVAAIPQIVLTIVNSLVAAIPQLIQGAVDFLLAIVNAIPQIIPPLVEAIPQIITTLVGGLITAIPQLIAGAMQLLMSIINAIPQIIPPLIEAIPQIITTLVDGLIIAIPQLVDGAVQLLMAIVDAIPIIIEAIVPEIPGIVMTIIDELLRLLPVLLDASITLLMATVDAIPEIVMMLIQETPTIVQAIIGVLKELPRLIWGVFTQVLGKVGEFTSKMTQKATETATKFLGKIGEYFRQIPDKIRGWLSGALSKVSAWGTNLANKGKEAANKLVNSVKEKLEGLVDKVKNIGRDLVSGLWNGIKDKFSWLKNKLSSFASDTLKSIKNFFGVHSPSTETEWVGDMLDQGLAKGVQKNADAPIKAMRSLSTDMLDETASLNGLTLERRLNQSYDSAPVGATDNALLSKLDQLLEAVERGSVIMLDGTTLVGSTADRYDSKLGQRRVLAERGAI